MAVMIESVERTKSGKAWRVKASGKYYNAFLDSGIENHVGKMIEAEIHTHEKFGSSIAAFRVVNEQNAAPQVQTPPAGGIPPSQSPAAAASPYKYAEPNLNVAPWWMPFVSNSVAHAIQAGIITAPNQIQAWAMAAKEAARGLVTKTPATQESDIPF